MMLFCNIVGTSHVFNDVLLSLKLEGEEFVRNKILQSYEIFKDKIEQGSVAVKRKK